MINLATPYCLRKLSANSLFQYLLIVFILFLFANSLMLAAGSTPITFLKPLLTKGFKNVPSFDAISITKSLS